MGRKGHGETAGPGEATPNLIRAACRARFYAGLDTLATIAADGEEKAADRVRALDTLGRFGLGAADQAQVHIHAGDGATVIGVVRLPALGEVIESGELVRSFSDELHPETDGQNGNSEEVRQITDAGPDELQQKRGPGDTGNGETAHAAGPGLAPSDSGPRLLTSGRVAGRVR
jgi:hypothetical protein